MSGDETLDAALSSGDKSAGQPSAAIAPSLASGSHRVRGQLRFFAGAVDD
ncbi:hypothetical protein MMEU_5205 [Mycobacterium marinum str. Europe]|nr:hypothetical protein MMEU_5205 [Mycobacterium marinum str. Europe]